MGLQLLLLLFFVMPCYSCSCFGSGAAFNLRCHLDLEQRGGVGGVRWLCCSTPLTTTGRPKSIDPAFHKCYLSFPCMSSQRETIVATLCHLSSLIPCSLISSGTFIDSDLLVHKDHWIKLSFNMAMQRERLESQWTQSAAALLLELPKGLRIYTAAIFDRYSIFVTCSDLTVLFNALCSVQSDALTCRVQV